MNYFLLSLFLLISAQPLRCISVFKINTSPLEVHKYIDPVDGSDLNSIQYAPKTDERPVAVTRNEAGKFVYKNRIIHNPSDYTEEHYDTHDYHGQDGLGQYLYGYEDWNQAKNEKKDVSGKIKGAYKYRQDDGQEMIVSYYADATGFHVKDNRPAFLKSLPTKTPEVQKAEETHLKLWMEIAVSRGHSPEDAYKNEEGRNFSTPEEKSYDEKQLAYDPSKDTEPIGFFYANDFNLPLLQSKAKSVIK